MKIVLLALAMAHAGTSMPPSTAHRACRGQLDAAVVDDTRCLGPAHDDAAIAPDLIPEPAALRRDPAIFPGELGFVSGIFALAGSALVASALLQTDRQSTADDLAVRDGLLIGGASAFALSGLVAGAALSTWVFDPSTATLRLPIFEGETN